MSDGATACIHMCALSDDSIRCMAAMATPVFQDVVLLGFSDPHITASAVMSGYICVIAQKATNFRFTNHHITASAVNVGLLML